MRDRPDDVVLRYADRSSVMLWTVGLLGLLEVGVVHVLTRSVPVLRWTLFAAGVLGLAAFLAWGAALRRRPHVLRADALVLRQGRTHAVEVPLATLRSARRHVVGTHRRILEVDDGALSLAFIGDTNVELRLDPPAEVEVRGRVARIGVVRFWADDADAAVRAVRAPV